MQSENAQDLLVAMNIEQAKANTVMADLSLSFIVLYFLFVCCLFLFEHIFAVHGPGFFVEAGGPFGAGDCGLHLSCPVVRPERRPLREG